jgi:adenosine deaminase
LIPKAELHCHLEGSIPPRWRASWRRATAWSCRRPDGRRRLLCLAGFLSFLAAYDRVCMTLRQPRDFGDVLYAYLAGRRARARSTSRCSARPNGRRRSASPTAPGSMPWSRPSTGRGATSASKGRIIVICIRHLGPDKALAMVRAMVAEPHHYVVGFGMGGDEAKLTPADFAPAYRLAQDKGYGCTVHAGEVMGPESVWAPSATCR